MWALGTVYSLVCYVMSDVIKGNGKKTDEICCTYAARAVHTNRGRHPTIQHIEYSVVKYIAHTTYTHCLHSAQSSPLLVGLKCSCSVDSDMGLHWCYTASATSHFTLAHRTPAPAHQHQFLLLFFRSMRSSYLVLRVVSVELIADHCVFCGFRFSL